MSPVPSPSHDLKAWFVNTAAVRFGGPGLQEELSIRDDSF